MDAKKISAETNYCKRGDRYHWLLPKHKLGLYTLCSSDLIEVYFVTLSTAKYLIPIVVIPSLLNFGGLRNYMIKVTTGEGIYKL